MCNTVVTHTLDLHTLVNQITLFWLNIMCFNTFCRITSLAQVAIIEANALDSFSRVGAPN